MKRFYSPNYYSIHNRLLLRRRPPQIDTGSFNTFVPHKVSKERNVVKGFQEVFSISMSE